MTTDEITLAEGTKADNDKLRWDLLPMVAVKETVGVLTFGANKYAGWNWAKGIKYSRVYAAAQRHMYAWWEDGEEYDPESGYHHLAHLMCCVLFLLTYRLLKDLYGEYDDRPKSQYPVR